MFEINNGLCRISIVLVVMFIEMFLILVSGVNNFLINGILFG